MKEVSNRHLQNLLDDELFIRWILHPTTELNEIWQERMDSDRELKNNIVALKNIIENLQVEEPELSGEAKEMVWSRIEQQINTNKKKRIRNSALLWTASVAASAIIAIGGYFFFLTNSNESPEIDYSLYTANNDDDEMRSGNINLVLSDNKRIDIVKDSTVISYDAEGSVNIDSERVAEASGHTQTDAPKLNQLIVPFGKTTALILSDGTKIWVNSGSKLVYPAVFDKSRREIFLTGEAFLDVARNEKAPFIIKTNDVELNVLGTSFNLSAYNDDSTQSVVLVSGSVEVKSKEMKGSYKIEPHQMLSFDKGTNKVNIEKVDVEYYTSWINGYILSNKESLDNLFHKLSRHFNVVFHYNKQDFLRTTFSGKLDLKFSLPEILENIAIANNNKLRYEIKNDIIELTLSK